MLQTLEIRQYGPVCDVSETGPCMYHKDLICYTIAKLGAYRKLQNSANNLFKKIVHYETVLADLKSIVKQRVL